ncbi:hypothetical protein D4S03_09075 [bacterium]|nr:MAG: hypothetical protein D4S03_09075 [bacterium]
MKFLKETFQRAIGMPLPKIPMDEGELIPLDDKSDKCLLYGSKVAAENPFLIQGSIGEFIKESPDGYFLIGFWGHGINSYAFYYSRVDSWSRVFLRLGYGGVYMHNELEAKYIKDFLIRYFDFENKIQSHVKELIVIESMMEGLYRVILPNGKKHEIRKSLLRKPNFEDRFGHLLEKSTGVRNMDNIPHSFRGYAGDPESELDVAFLLGLVLDYLPFRLVVSSINDAFPDCEGFDPVTGAPVRIELEVFSRNYKLHGHPSKGCHYIVCWRDNWPESETESGIKVISLEDIIYKNNLDGKHFIFIPKPGSLREQLDDLKERDAEVYQVVYYFLNDVLEKIFQKYKGTRINDRLTKHFSVRAANGKGVFGIYPHGKLVCLKVNEFVKRFGDDIAESAKVFRETILGIKILRSTKDADRAGEALDVFLNAISKEK